MGIVVRNAQSSPIEFGIPFALTRRECVVPPVRFAEKRLQVIGSAAHNDVWRRDQSPDQQTGANGPADDAQALEQGGICDFHSLGGADTENYRYPAGEKSTKSQVFAGGLPGY